MLKSLYIKNYALLSEVEIRFGEGLNVLTGETGAGKSIIVGALGTILGERVDTGVLRSGGSKAVVEGVFNIAQNERLRSYLQQRELLDSSEELILRREIHDNARSRAFINDTPVQLSVMQEVSDMLVDLHGQHEHQSLLRVQHHLTLIDEFADLGADVHKVAAKFQQLQDLHAELDALKTRQRGLEEKRELYAFQIREIEKVAPLEDEEEALLKEEKIAKNSERLFSLTDELYRMLYDDERSAYDILSRVDSGLHELQTIDESFGAYTQELSNARITIEELAKFLEAYKSKIEFSPQRLEEIESRIAQLTGLKKKYGKSISEILEYQKELQHELSNLDNLQERIAAITEEIEREKACFSELCTTLSSKRRAAADRLEKLIPEILDYLGMSNARFKIVLKYQDDPKGWVYLHDKEETYRATDSGMDLAEFMISANKGMELRPLARVVSGGEISRIMLALKSVLAKQGQIPVLVFDEIDNGVSGRIAQAVGRKLRQLAQTHQIICITHLPQIASLGQHHFCVEKVEKGGRTETSIRQLAHDERTIEIAKLLAGENVSEAHLNSARELLQEASVN